MDKIIFLGLLGIGFIQCLVLPLKKCNIADSKCIVLTSQNLLPDFAAGIPEYGTAVLDPLPIDDVKFNLYGLQFNLSNGVMRGMKNIIFDDAEWDLEKKTANYKFHTDATVNGHYIAEGKILGLPISGDGEIIVELKNMQMTVSYIYDFVNIGGKDHVEIKKYEFDFDVKDNAHYDLTNLFNGNKELSDAALNFSNKNWHQFALTLGRPLIDVVLKKIVYNMNKLFKNVPFEDIFDV